ncbi:hypothetical protein CCP3SC15_60029 [Gammaproteobacteria bacterium]
MGYVYTTPTLLHPILDEEGSIFPVSVLDVTDQPISEELHQLNRHAQGPGVEGLLKSASLRTNSVCSSLWTVVPG